MEVTCVQCRSVGIHIIQISIRVSSDLEMGFFQSRVMRVRCRSVVRVFAHGAMGRRIDPSWSGPIELFLVPASAPRLV